MTIKQLLNMSIGQKIGGFSLTIKTAKKKWQDGDGVWMQTALLTDKTGDILADVILNQNVPLQRQQELHITVAEIQSSEDTIKLYVDQSYVVSATEPPDYSQKNINWLDQNEKIARSKIRCLLVCADKQAGTESNKEDIRYWEDFIITGE